MTPLGKCMVFYFKYQPEMLLMYWKDQKPDDLEDPEIPKMVNAVGEKCCQEVSEFLTECGTIIQKHFETVGSCQLDRISDRKWNVSYGIWQKGGHKPPKQNWRMQAGIDIPRTRAEIIPWVWGRGRSEAEEKMILEFGDQVKRSGEVDMPTGRVALARIPILPEKVDGLDIDRDELLKQVEQAFSPISQQKLDNVYNSVRNLKG
jgi:hypothetical protein